MSKLKEQILILRSDNKSYNEIANYSKSDLTVEEYLELCKKVLEHYGYTVNKI